MATSNKNGDGVNQMLSFIGKLVNQFSPSEKPLGSISGKYLAISFRWRGSKCNYSLHMLMKQDLISAHLGLARYQESQIWGAHQWAQAKDEDA